MVRDRSEFYKWVPGGSKTKQKLSDDNEDATLQEILDRRRGAVSPPVQPQPVRACQVLVV